jgi:hypothetical protein
MSPDYATQVIAATSKFQQTNKDPKASMYLGISTAVAADSSIKLLLNPVLFYDAPTPAPGIFEDFLTIPTLQGLGIPFNTTTMRDFVFAVRHERHPSAPTPRTVFSTVGLTACQPELLFSILNDTNVSALYMLPKSDLCGLTMFMLIRRF